MRVDEVSVKKFGLHMTFAPRFGWLKKAFDGVSNNPEIFGHDDAPKQLGVGKNMVDAIAFWATAFHIISPLSGKGKGGIKRYETTPLGRFIFDESTGVDQYLEDTNTLWLLHWNSLQPGCQLPVWWLSFNSFHAVEFASEHLQTFVLEQTAASSWNFTNANPIKKDVDCLLKMFAPRENQLRQTVDDFLDSPFRDLGLLTQSTLTKGDFRFEYGPKIGLSPSMALATCLDFVARTTPDARTVTVGRLVNDHGSPGRLMKLSEQALGELLNKASKLHPGIVSLTSPTGSTQLNSNQDARIAAEIVLHACYQLSPKGKTGATGIGSRSFGGIVDAIDRSNHNSTSIKKLDKDTAVEVAPKKAPKQSSNSISLSKSPKKKVSVKKKPAKKKVSI